MQEVLVPLDIEVGRHLIAAGVDYIFYGADMECPLLISPDHYRELVHQPIFFQLTTDDGQLTRLTL